MAPDTLLALMGFAFVTSVTPGPSNLILLAAGANHGFRRSLPLILGVNVSFLSMLLTVGFGLGQLIQTNQAVHNGLRMLSLLYILWLAWKIARSSPPGGEDGEEASAPVRLTFLQMAMLQWVNPKAWAVALAVTAAYTTPEGYTASLLALTALFGIVNLPSISVWAASGGALKRLLGQPGKVRAFNLCMAALLVASMVPVLLEIGGR